jgi:hypothetical protein
MAKDLFKPQFERMGEKKFFSTSLKIKKVPTLPRILNFQALKIYVSLLELVAVPT